MVILMVAALVGTGVFSATPASAESNWTRSTPTLDNGVGCVWADHLRERTSAAETATTEDAGGNTCTTSWASLYYIPAGGTTLQRVDTYQADSAFARASKSGTNEAIAQLGCMWNGFWSCYLHYAPEYGGNYDQWWPV